MRAKTKTGEKREKPRQKRAMSLHFQRDYDDGPRVGLRRKEEMVFCFLSERTTTDNQVIKALESGLKQALPGAFFRLEEDHWRKTANATANAYRLH